MSLDSLTGALASESIDWMIENEQRPDPYGDVLPFALATFVDGTAITPRGFDETDKFGGREQ